MHDLAHRMHRAELVWRDGGDAAGRAALAQDFLHPVVRGGEVVTVADEDEIGLAGEHLDHMGDDRLAVDFNQRFGDGVTGAAEAFAEAGHGDDDLHGGSAVDDAVDRCR